MKRRENKQLNKNGKDAVFVALVAPLTLNEMYGKDSGKTINVTLMQSRWDGRLGFPGGKVDAGETLEEAALRELKEETGYEMTMEDFTENSEFVCTHEFQAGRTTMNTHLYTIKTSLDVMKEIMVNTTNADHFAVENNGGIIVHLETYGRKGLKAFIKNNMASSVKEEIAVLVNSINPQIAIDAEMNFNQDVLEINNEEI